MASIYVNGIAVPVSLMDGEVLDCKAKGEGVAGSVNVEDGILVRAGMYAGETASTILHEALHLAFTLPESDIIALERFLMCLFRENAADFGWLDRIVQQARAEYDADSADEDEDDGD
jgi:hypothetical protein